jgi:two-component system KDP operon response regulator KdpE
MTTLLLIEDEPQMRRVLRGSLPAADYVLVEASTAKEGIALAPSCKPDVILLDLGLPDMDGIEVTERLREWAKTPIIVLSARDQDRDKVAALDAGADDYLTKPFSLPELMARIRAAARRGEGTKSDGVIDVEDVRIDLANRVVTKRGEEVRLTPREYQLLSVLARSAGRAMTYQRLLKDVWGIRSDSRREYLHVYMGHLRNKLESDPTRPRFLLTDPGVGYRFKASD